jgi:hypothetical protein
VDGARPGFEQITSGWIVNVVDRAYVSADAGNFAGNWIVGIGGSGAIIVPADPGILIPPQADLCSTPSLITRRQIGGCGALGGEVGRRRGPMTRVTPFPLLKSRATVDIVSANA